MERDECIFAGTPHLLTFKDLLDWLEEQGACEHLLGHLWERHIKETLEGTVITAGLAYVPRYYEERVGCGCKFPQQPAYFAQDRKTASHEMAHILGFGHGRDHDLATYVLHKHTDGCAVCRRRFAGLPRGGSVNLEGTLGKREDTYV